MSWRREICKLKKQSYAQGDAFGKSPINLASERRTTMVIQVIPVTLVTNPKTLRAMGVSSYAGIKAGWESGNAPMSLSVAGEVAIGEVCTAAAGHSYRRVA